jgi:hypothetical protein
MTLTFPPEVLSELLLQPTTLKTAVLFAIGRRNSTINQFIVDARSDVEKMLMLRAYKFKLSKAFLRTISDRQLSHQYQNVASPPQSSTVSSMSLPSAAAQAPQEHSDANLSQSVPFFIS